MTADTDLVNPVSDRTRSVVFSDRKERLERIKAEAERLANPTNPRALAMQSGGRKEPKMTSQSKVDRAVKEMSDKLAKMEVRREALRTARENDRQQAEALRRESNPEHVDLVHREIIEDLVLVGINETLAKIVVNSIAKGRIANVSITY